jgi:hypothetical protein
METKIVLGLMAAALVAACTSTPRWDVGSFPEQPVYEGTNASVPPVAEASK